MQGVSEKVKRVFSSYGISTCFKPLQILRQILVEPKNKTKIEHITVVVYRIPCGSCNKVYVGETKRTVGERIKEHMEFFSLSAIAEHYQKKKKKKKKLARDNIKVLCREDKMIPRKVREAIFIRKETNPTLNRDMATGGVKDILFTSRNT